MVTFLSYLSTCLMCLSRFSTCHNYLFGHLDFTWSYTCHLTFNSLFTIVYPSLFTCLNLYLRFYLPSYLSFYVYSAFCQLFPSFKSVYIMSCLLFISGTSSFYQPSLAPVCLSVCLITCRTYLSILPVFVGCLFCLSWWFCSCLIVYVPPCFLSIVTCLYLSSCLSTCFLAYQFGVCSYLSCLLTWFLRFRNYTFYLLCLFIFLGFSLILIFVILCLFNYFLLTWFIFPPVILILISLCSFTVFLPVLIFYLSIMCSVFLSTPVRWCVEFFTCHF